ncbi:uncharacterized protein [Dermacentor albipictus]|uniref:uncharacterized protein n=1 Tax=Dermacentor albipictus TaxID=60249 RepID=UPI0031FCDEEA
MVHARGITPRYHQQSWQKHSCHRPPDRPHFGVAGTRNIRRQGTPVFHGSQQQQHRLRAKEQRARQGTAIAMKYDPSSSEGPVYAHGFQKNKCRDERRCHHWAGPECGRCKRGASHIDGAMARGPCHHVRFSERASQCAATAAAMQPGRGGHWTIKLPSSDFLLAAAGAAATTRPAAAKPVAGTKPAAVAVTAEPQPAQPQPQASAQLHHHHSQWALQNYMQLVCRDKRGGGASQHQQHQQQRHKQTSSRLADVVAAGAFYSATSTTSYWQQQQQQQPDDSYVMYRTSAAEQRIFQQVGPYASWRDMRPKIGCVPIRQTTCADGDGHLEPSDHQDGGFTHPGQLHSFLAFQHQEHQQQQNWDQDSYLPYQDGVPGINGQGDGDAPAYGGGAAALGGADGADVLRDEQDEVVALLAEIDERHEKHLAFERVLQEREPTFWRHRWRTQPQFPSQHLLYQQQIIGTAGSCDSVEVFVDGGVWRSVSDNGLYDRSDRRLCPPFRVVQSRTSSVFFARFAADDITARYAQATGSLTPPPSRGSTPSPVPVVAVGTSTPPHQGSPESGNAAASAPHEDRNEKCVEPKCGDEASGGKVEGKVSPFVVHRHSPVQVKEAACALPATRNQQPSQHVQRQEPVDATAMHQQRKASNDFRRPSYPRREYHSTRRYNEHDHSTPPPPPSSLDRPPGGGRQFKTTDGGRFPQNGQCREAFNNRPHANNNHHHYSDGGAYARGQQQPPRGGSHSANRNRNRPNNNNRQCNGANQWNKDRARQDAGPDVGNRGGFAAHRSSLPYCCRSVAGGSRVASPADASAVPTPPPASHRGRRYNNKQGGGGAGGCGGQAQVQRQYSASRPSPQQVSPTSRDIQSAGARSVAAIDNNGGRHPSNRKPSGDASSRKPRRQQQQQQQQQQQRADYNQPRCASSRAGESATATSPTLGSRKSCESLPTGCGNGDAAAADCADGDLAGDALNRRSMSLRMFWERTNLTIFRRRTSQ